MNNIKAKDSVLIIWKGNEQNDLINLSNEIKTASNNGSVFLENADVLTESKYKNPWFLDIVWKCHCEIINMVCNSNKVN